MSRLGGALILTLHLYRVWRSGQLRFRLETFGLYYPALPYRSPAWRFPVANALLLLRQAHAYAAWVVEMERIRRHGPDGWWDHAVVVKRQCEAAGDPLDG
jgi:hypothetical protein